MLKSLSLAAVLAVGEAADATSWDSISPHLLEHWRSSLPPLPTARLEQSQYEPVATQGAFQVMRTQMVNVSLCDPAAAAAAAVWPSRTVSAGPTVLCDGGSPCTSGFVSGETCKAAGELNGRGDEVVLFQRHGTFWTRQHAQPAWVQLHFPVPARTGFATFRFTMDERYAPLARGGNPCPRAQNESGYQCALCTAALTGGPWDYNAKAGVYVLWSVPGMGKHEITGPLDVYDAYIRGERTPSIDSPPGLDLSSADEVTITLFTFNQYPFTGELEDGVNDYVASNPTKCSVDWTKGEHDKSGGNALLIVLAASLSTRSVWNPATTPAVGHPRVFGTDDVWDAQHNQPFYQAPCSYDRATSPGWGGAAGIPDFKSSFEATTLGYSSCYTTGSKWVVPPATLSEHASVAASYGNPDFKSFTSATTRNAALQALHLVRRLRACHKKGTETCQFPLADVDAFAKDIVVREFASFDPDARVQSSESWGWEQDSDGCCGFDLFSTSPVKHFSLFIDILREDAEAVDAARLQQIEAKLEHYIDLFLQAFDSGHWSLWNGNNWTPWLSAAATYWAIVYWHEKPEKARRLMHAIVDVMLLHLPMIKDDGVYVEGLCQYSYMSLTSTLDVAALYKDSFGERFPSVNYDALMKLASWHVDAFESAGHAVDFGDSWDCRGTTVDTLYAATALTIASPPGTADGFVLDPCWLRRWSTTAYYLQFSEPWTIWPVLASFMGLDASAMVGACGEEVALPLGPAQIKVYSDGGYGMLRTPLSPPCATGDDGCSAGALPLLTDVMRYAMIAVQARPNAFPHSEVDYATFKWTSHGVTLLSEYGYGTIATAVGPWDMRRYGQIDNNPAGHNTLVIREAYKAGSEEINFSQLHQEAGSVELLDGDLGCMHLDGSAVYGSTRTNGWLAYMHRWICALPGGHFVVVDALAAQPGRGALALYGSLYGGPDFDEGSAHAELTVDEYFHTPSWLDGKDVTAYTEAEKAFNRSLAGKWCNHVDIELAQEDQAGGTVRLHPRCGLEGYTDAPNVAEATAWSKNGGHFVVDGLTTAGNVWGAPTMHLNRFRYESSSTLSSGGDLRAFLLTSWRAAEPHPKGAVLETACPAGTAGGVTCLNVTASGETTMLQVAASAGAATFVGCRGSCPPSATSAPKCVKLSAATVASLSAAGYRVPRCPS